MALNTKNSAANKADSDSDSDWKRQRRPGEHPHKNVDVAGKDSDRMEEIKGFLSEDEGRALYEYARKASAVGPCLEIGSYCGKSAAYLGAGCREHNGILFSVDHHRGSEEQQPGEEYFDPELFEWRSQSVDTLGCFRRTLARLGLEETVVPIVSASSVAARAWSTPLALVFVDGGHRAETVFADYDAWSGHVMPGGFLIFHDIYPDPADGGQAPYHAYRTAEASGLYRAEAGVGSLGVLRRL